MTDSPKNEASQKSSFERAAALLRVGDAEQAELMCANALVEFPDDANFMCLSGRALIMLGRYDDAEARLDAAIEQFPDFSRPHVIIGEMRLSQGRPEDAAQALQRAIELGDDDPNTQLKLGRAYMLMGDADAAKKAVNESMRLDPARSELARAYELEQSGKGKEAEDIYRNVLARDPHNVEALRLLAATASSQKRYRDAEILLLRAIELAPDFGRALADLVICQIELEKIEEGIENAGRLTRIAGDNPDSFTLLASSLSNAGRYSEAIAAYRSALHLSPKHTGALSGLAHNLKTIGRQDEAIDCYRKCIAANPYFTEPYWSLANLKTFRFEDDEVASMEKLVADPNIPDDALVHLSNALGLEYEGRKDFDRAFASFERCNSTRRKDEYFDPVELEAKHDEILDTFNSELLSGPGSDRSTGITPIFIIGLPRSGSTLLEQILASHSLVEGTHELSDLGRVVNEIPKLLKIRKRYPHSVADIDPGGFARLGVEYLERTSKYRVGNRFFIDKNPNNFVHVGLLHLMMPDAVIINAQRHPLDSCLGSYKQLFAKGQAFSYDLTELAEYYLQYYRITDHWSDALPGKVLNVQYEDVVADLEGQVSRLLDHCSLPFEDACLNFHETERAVKTASSEQVRQPIYSTSVNLWRNYEQHLAAVIDVLEPVLRNLPEDSRPVAFR